VRQKLGRPANTFHAQAYDAASILFDAIKRANSTVPSVIRDAISKTSRFSGVLGRSMTFDEKGQIHGVELAVVQWKAGKRVPMGPCIKTGTL
jgi:branched-chain amino acid transport system substrate-binding protein